MSRIIVSTLYDPERKRRVVIFKRNDGTFGFQEEHLSDAPHERCWIPAGTHRSECRCADLRTTLREAHGRIEWLSEIHGSDQAGSIC